MIIDRDTAIKIYDYMSKNTEESVQAKCKKLNISIATYYRTCRTYGIGKKKLGV